LPSDFSAGLAQAKIGKNYCFIDKNRKMEKENRNLAYLCQWLEEKVRVRETSGATTKLTCCQLDRSGRYFSLEKPTLASIYGKYGFID